MNGFRYKDSQPSYAMGHHYAFEEVCVPPTFSSKKKKHASSDPRFKRVISTEEENEKMQKFGRGMEKHKKERMISNLNASGEGAALSGGGFLRNFVDQKEISRQALTEAVTKDVGFSIPSKYLQGCINDGNLEMIREPEKVKTFSKTNLERSASDCTLHTKNTCGDDNEEERVRSFPSTTRVYKVHDWMKEYKVVPEKKRSVITVIGQTQTKPFNKVLYEINQRRKLAKELDKHALCEAIMQPEPQSDLVAKGDFVLSDGKVLNGTDKLYLCKDSKSNTDHYCGENMTKKTDGLDNREHLRKRCEMIPERDNSYVNKKQKSRRLVKKSISSRERKKQVRDSIKAFYVRYSRSLFWSFLLLLCLSLTFYASLRLFRPSKSFFFYDVFQPKPTPWYESWYERLLF